jgi:hypothetical protein
MASSVPRIFAYFIPPSRPPQSIRSWPTLVPHHGLHNPSDRGLLLFLRSRPQSLRSWPTLFLQSRPLPQSLRSWPTFISPITASSIPPIVAYFILPITASAIPPIVVYFYFSNHGPLNSSDRGLLLFLRSWPPLSLRS